MNDLLRELPHNTGCYLFKNSKGHIIYVGKANDLKKRVSSYFQKKDHDAKTQALVKQIHEVDFIVTKNTVEALLLENNLIKKHSPRYNIDLKDAKRYAYIRLTKDDFPRLLTARKKDEAGEYFGPFVSGMSREYLISLLSKSFKLRTCKKLPKRACLRYHMGICTAPCIKKDTKETYNERVNAVRAILKGDTKKIERTLEKNMKQAAKKHQFEQAIEYRNQRQAIEWIKERQRVERTRQTNEDIINFERRDGIVYLMLFHIDKGTLTGKQEFVFDQKEEFLEEFLLQYYTDEQIPKEIILPQKTLPELQEALSQRGGSKVKVEVPKQGDKKELLDLVKKNIELSFFGEAEKLLELKKVLKLNEVPQVIECFDISHLSGTSTVASMVQFRNAKPDKNNYRRFKIRTVDYIDDFDSMREVVRRRYKRLMEEKAEMPNLIVIDGGLGQLSVALDEITKLGVNVPIISLAKQFEEIYRPGIQSPLRLSKKSKALHLLQQIRDEAHRFAITYNRLLRKKKLRE